MKKLPTACARHIIVKNKQLAQTLKTRIEQGEDFAVLAKKYSQCPSAKKGGNLGEFQQGDMVRPFDQVVFKKPLLTLHGPIKTQFGYHLVETLYRDD